MWNTFVAENATAKLFHHVLQTKNIITVAAVVDTDTDLISVHFFVLVSTLDMLFFSVMTKLII
jgi:hypothetical protein